jgi:dethiobiotin synthetase
MLVVITGTGTEVGKTWYGAGVAIALQANDAHVIARKPVQSFAPGDDTAHVTDADVLAAATGQPVFDICPEHRWYPRAVAPPMAAELLGRPPFTIEDLAAEHRAALPAPTAGTIVLVEGAGGPRSPLADDGDTVDLADALDADTIVLVSDASLGAINAARLAAAPFALRTLVVALNRYDASDDLHRRNAAWLQTREGLEVVTSPEALAAVLQARARYWVSNT